MVPVWWYGTGTIPYHTWGIRADLIVAAARVKGYTLSYSLQYINYTLTLIE